MLQWGEEAADTVQLVMPHVLQCQMRLVQLDRTGAPSGDGAAAGSSSPQQAAGPTVMHFPELPSVRSSGLKEASKARSKSGGGGGGPASPSGGPVKSSSRPSTPMKNAPSAASPRPGTPNSKKKPAAAGGNREDGGASGGPGAAGAAAEEPDDGDGLAPGTPGGGNRPMKSMKKSSSSKGMHTNSSNHPLNTDEPLSLDPPVDVCLLFKPGHYDILYPMEVGVEVADCEKRLDLVAKCREPWECCICMCKEVEEDGEKNVIMQPWWCEDRVCANCRPTLPDGDSKCPVCSAMLRDGAWGGP